MSRPVLKRCDAACTDPYDPCGSGCPGVLEIPILAQGFGPVYASAAAAIAALANFAASCLAWFQDDAGGGPITLSSLSASFSSGILSLSGTGTGAAPIPYVYAFASITIEADGATISVDYNVATDGTNGETPAVGIDLYDCLGNFISGDYSAFASGALSSGTLTIPSVGTIPAGEYIIDFVYFGKSGGPSSATAAFDMSCDKAYHVNPVVALYDDGSGVMEQAC